MKKSAYCVLGALALIALLLASYQVGFVRGRASAPNGTPVATSGIEPTPDAAVSASPADQPQQPIATETAVPAIPTEQPQPTAQPTAEPSDAPTEPPTPTDTPAPTAKQSGATGHTPRPAATNTPAPTQTPGDGGVDLPIDVF